MDTLYKPEKVFVDIPAVPADVEACLLKLQQIQELHGGLTTQELTRNAARVRKTFSEGDFRAGRNRLWKLTLVVCAWALAHQRRVRRHLAAEWVPLGTVGKQDDTTNVRGVYNLLRACMLQSAIIWDPTDEVATHVNQILPCSRRGRARLTLTVKRKRAVLHCAGLTVRTELIRGWGPLDLSGYTTLTPLTPENLQPMVASCMLSTSVVRPAAELCNSVAGGGAHRVIKQLRITTLTTVPVPYRWCTHSGLNAPILRRGRMVRHRWSAPEYRASRRGYGVRMYRRRQRQILEIGTKIVVL